MKEHAAYIVIALPPMFIAFKCTLYTGSQDGQEWEPNQGERVVLDLANNMQGSGRIKR